MTAKESARAVILSAAKDLALISKRLTKSRVLRYAQDDGAAVVSSYDALSMTEPLLTLSNPMRYLVPIGTAAFTVVMFIVPIFIAGVDSRWVVLGTVGFTVCVVWLCRSAWRAPHALRLENDHVTIDRLAGPREYPFAQIRKWWFAIPDGKPTQAPPAVNGVVYVVLADGTRFRGEVTAAEGALLARLLPAA